MATAVQNNPPVSFWSYLSNAIKDHPIAFITSFLFAAIAVIFNQGLRNQNNNLYNYIRDNPDFSTTFLASVFISSAVLTFLICLKLDSRR